MSATEFDAVQLGATCETCGRELVLNEDGGDYVVLCPMCDQPQGTGATVSDALDDYIAQHPAPVFLPSPLTERVPRHPWIIECGGFPFNTLTEAETYANDRGLTIHCRLASSQKAANDK